MDTIKSTLSSVTPTTSTSQDAEPKKDNATMVEKLDNAAKSTPSKDDQRQTHTETDHAVDGAHDEQVADFVREQYKSEPVQEGKGM
ncbi:MAG: hypothetical protein M1832_005630 [Thelocarpon impressellum]|nr:MAG: hypothetical protein M1832_005630 [Thelocarpon impressellum]